MTPRRFTVYVLPLLVWMLVIFGWSTDAGSAEHTRSWLQRLLSDLPLLRDLPPARILDIDYGIRKAAHITEYAILAVLAFRAVRRERQTFRDVDVWGVLLLCVAYAATDELHQLTVASRFGTVGDVLYDTFGAMVGVVACLWLTARATASPAPLDLMYSTAKSPPPPPA
ncbi:MAG: VanZ family protein [Armatimonadetes bacterium]|nr:VanZ family protein [Armatimonadota bacterium]